MRRSTEQGYRSLFDNMLNGVAYCRMRYESGLPADFVYLDVNRAFEELTGLKDVVGRSVTEVIPGIRDSNPELFEIYGRVARTGAPEKFETFVAPLGIWFSISVYRPQADHFVAVFENTTERKRAEEKVRENANILRNIIESTTDTVFVKDTSLRMLMCNSVLARMVGKAPEELYGKTDIENGWSPALVKGDPQRSIIGWERSDLKALAGMTVRATEEPSSLGEDARFFDTVKMPLRDEKGVIIGLLGMGRDVTDRQFGSRRLRELAALLDIATDAILVRDMGGRVTFWNKGAERMYGWSAEEMQGRDPDVLLQTLPAELQAARASTTARGEWAGEMHRVTKDGRALVVEARWTLVRDEGGNPTGVLAVNTDVTERRAIQSQLLRVQRLESLGTLAGGIAHDLNNVLAPILMGVEGLSLQHGDESSRKILDIVRTSANRGAAIVRQVLSFARGMEGARAEVQLKHVLREVEEIFRETFPRSIEIVARVPKDLWPVLGDANQLHQVMMNLGVNARDAMADGGTLTLGAENAHVDEAYSRVHIEARPIRYVVLKVEDTGTGMPPDVVEKIFDPFFTTKDPGKGTGLGLSTARTIVKSHGGFITVYSEPGKGTAFKVYIPAVDQVSSESGEGIGDGVPMGEGELVLVVDDEAGVREMAREILGSYGYRAMTAGDGAEGVALFAQHQGEVRAVITDLMMPYMDGSAMIRSLRRIDPEVRIIATSGLMSDGPIRPEGSDGVKAYLGKPYTAEALLETLRQVLDAPRGDAPR